MPNVHLTSLVIIKNEVTPKMAELQYPASHTLISKSAYPQNDKYRKRRRALLNITAAACLLFASCTSRSSPSDEINVSQPSGLPGGDLSLSGQQKSEKNGITVPDRNFRDSTALLRAHMLAWHLHIPKWLKNLHVDRWSDGELTRDDLLADSYHFDRDGTLNCLEISQLADPF